jgi:hypothetical protein
MNETIVKKHKKLHMKIIRSDLGSLEIRPLTGDVRGFCESDGCEKMGRLAGPDHIRRGLRNATKQVYIVGYPDIKLCDKCSKDWVKWWQENIKRRN